MGKTTTLPIGDGYYVTDPSGEVTFKIGKMNYTEKANPVEEHYWIFLKKENTTRKIYSEGKGNFKEVIISYVRKPTRNLLGWLIDRIKI